MGKRQQNEALTRSQIMDVAFTLFCDQGIESTEMMQIAKKAKVSRPTLYRYFETKERLAEEVYLHNLEITLIMRTDYPDGLSTFEIIKQFLNFVFEELQTNPKGLVYDAMYNLYASRKHIDPTTILNHPLNTSRYKEVLEAANFIHPDESIRFLGDGNALMHAVLYPFFSYIQRLAIFSFQKDASSWEETLRQANILREFYLNALKPEPSISGE
jgi:AcrR family transcriptional regulator